ncbi:MAG: heme-binding protein [Cyanobacteriota bacterium]|nr:heme-binding protein [Cyanobacteriota bacterium]
MKKILLSFLILVTILIGNPLTAMAEEMPSPESFEKSIVEFIQSPSQKLPPNFLRLSDDIEETVEDLGPLSELAGTWVGKGWNMIAVPINSDSPSNIVGCPGKAASPERENFCLEIMPYVETLTFTPIGAPVPNRGFPINTFVVGLHYEQVVSDANTFQPLHIENGMWLLLDKKEKLVARLSSIPHGNSLLAIGKSFDLDGNFQINTIDGLPILEKPALGYADPYFTVEGVAPFVPSNPNQILQDVIDKQKLLKTVVLDVSTDNKGGISNIPFIEKNADVTSFKSTFWIEEVEDKRGNEFLQLQYSQTTDLDFIKDFTSTTEPKKLIVWPHVDVATLVKQ